MNHDRAALDELARVVARGTAQTLLHYVYVPTVTAARETGTYLRARGFITEERLGADGINWLVLAKHHVVPTPELILGVRTLMEELARSHGGEYDGWEAALT
jgi:hypothetical protein